MATIHVTGTQLEPPTPRLPLIRPFLASLGVIYLLAMHFFMANPGGSGLALSFNATTWLAFGITIAIGLYQIGTEGKLRYNKLTIVLFISCLMMTAPVLYLNSSLLLSFNRLAGLWMGFLLLVVLQQFRFSNRQKQRLLWFIVIAVAIQAIFGWFQYLLLEPGNFFGYNTDSNRPYGIFQQPNVMASFLATGLAISGYLLSRQPIKYQRKLSDVSLLYVMPLLTIPLIIVLASRTGWLGAAIAVALVLPYLYRFATHKRIAGWSLSVLVGVMLGLVLPLLSASSNSSNVDLIEQKVNLESPRSYLYPQALDMFIEKPFTGYGYGSFEPDYIIYTARQHQLNPSYHVGLPALDHPHNELLFWGIEGGLLPVLGIILAALFVLLRMYQAKKGTRLAMFGLFVPIVLHSQLEYPFYHSFVHWITFIILLYWVDQRSNACRVASFSRVSQVAVRVMSLVLPIIISLYMLSSLHTNYVLTQFERSSPKAPEILEKVTNPIVWKDRYDWDVYSTYLNIGLITQNPDYIKPYIEWSLAIIKDKPRPAFYNNLIMAYLGLGDTLKAEQIRSEAKFLFPNRDFDKVQYIAPDIDALKPSAGQ
ncbi:O-antigen ligase C-terminal domain-containing protein [Vibrio sp. 404]|uniref:O-antigen ligase C-terminal domain-containing protein n=1 Tax=Vibrio marinisediminis TaxID=2758441 RepID=A0A7W2FPV5_9VIBR|nr:PglL family O-oligosaccharyltransferase [Vibrio marinisediminis]MBA5762091.1 O-antigen ligase C-terminal domain-containing protein [Vibrio marinisediminis]